jgi:BolA protein
MQVEQRIREKLNEAFTPDQLVIENDSRKHAHHLTARGEPNTGETHFTITIVSSAFDGRTRIDRQRLVYQVLAEELAGPVHALALKTMSPAEVPNA